MLVRYKHKILFKRIYSKHKSVTTPPLMFSCEIFEFFRSRQRKCFLKKLFLKILQYSQERYRQPCNFVKNRLQGRWFPLNITKLLRTPFSKNI